MKKVIAIVLMLTLILSFAACAPKTYEVALVTDVGNIDDQSFNQGAWEGVKQFAEANGKTYSYYRPTEDSDAARVEAMKTAVDKGAKVIFAPATCLDRRSPKPRHCIPKSCSSAST